MSDPHQATKGRWPAIIIFALVAVIAVHLSSGGINIFFPVVIAHPSPIKRNVDHGVLARSNDANDAKSDWADFDPELLSGPSSALTDKGKAAKQGSGLLCMMKAGVGQVPASPYTNPEVFKDFGYTPTNVEHGNANKISEVLEGLSLTKALAALNINTADSNWMQISAGHTKKWGPGLKNKPTYATISAEVSKDGKAYIATQSYGPEYMARREGIQTVIPQLQKVSDVTWLLLKKFLGIDTMKHIEHMFRWNTIVPEVQAHLKMVAGKDIKDIGEWPGVSYPIKELQAKATLSAANAKGVAWLLGQHKDELGVKTVDRVNIFNCPDQWDDPQWCVYLHIVNATP